MPSAPATRLIDRRRFFREGGAFAALACTGPEIWAALGSSRVAAAGIRFGCAAITWDGNDPQAIEDIADLGFGGIQLRDSAVRRWGEKPDELKALLAERKLTLELSPEAKHALTSEGYDPTYGARPLKRAIQRLIQNPLSLAILGGRFHEGDHIVATEGPDGEIVFQKAESPQEEPAVAAR